MKIIESIIYLLASIIDIYLIKLYLYNDIYITTFILIHIFISLIVYLLIQILDDKNKRLPIYLGLFIPIVGFTFIFFIDLILKVFKQENEFIEDYQKYIEYINQVILKNEINFEKEINTTVALDNLTYSDNETKKNVIVDLISDDIDIKVNILQKGLSSDDPEVVHYSSSILNLIESEYEKKIADLIDSYSNDRPKENLIELINTYDIYLKSGLLKDELLDFEYEKFLGFLNDYTSYHRVNYDVLIKELDTLVKLDRNEKAFEVLRFMYSLFPEKYEHYIYTLLILYNMRNFKEVSKVAKKIRDLDINIPEKYKNIVDYWITEGE